MPLNENQAVVFAKELMTALANSESIKVVGPTTGAGGEDTNIRRGRYDAVYLSTLYRTLVEELQK